MNETKLTRKPDFKGDGVAAWCNIDKNGRDYLAIKLVGHSTVAAFPPKADEKGDA